MSILSRPQCVKHSLHHHCLDSISKDVILPGIGNTIVEIRRSYDSLISTMGFPIPVRRQLYIESASQMSIMEFLTDKMTSLHRVSTGALESTPGISHNCASGKLNALEALIMTLNARCKVTLVNRFQYKDVILPTYRKYHCQRLSHDNLYDSLISTNGISAIPVLRSLQLSSIDIQLPTCP